MELVRYPKETIVGKDGLHLPATRGQDTETLCGIFKDGGMSIPEYEDGDRPECHHCIGIAQELFKKYTKKKVMSWK